MTYYGAGPTSSRKARGRVQWARDRARTETGGVWLGRVKNSWRARSSTDAPPTIRRRAAQFQGWLKRRGREFVGPWRAGQDSRRAQAQGRYARLRSCAVGGTASVSIDSTISTRPARTLSRAAGASNAGEECCTWVTGTTSASTRRAGRQHYNGAVDNATGVAGVLEIAEAFVAQEPAPARSVIFFVPTLEEVGTLGSRYSSRIDHAAGRHQGGDQHGRVHVGGRTANVR